MDGPWGKADALAVQEALSDTGIAVAGATAATSAAGGGRARDAASEMILLGRSLEDLKELCVREGQPSFRAKQLHDAVHSRGVRSLAEITDLPKPWRESLMERGYR